MFIPNQMTFDAQAALGFVQSQATFIETEVNEQVYPDIQYPGLIPVDTSAHPFTQTVTFYSGDKWGQANWINGNSDDIPMAGTERSTFKSPVYTAGIGYGYGWEELGFAMKMGINLPGDDANAARRAYEEFVDNVALRGDDRKNFEGLINYTGVTAAAAPNGDWENVLTTPAMILEDVNTLLLGTATDTLYTSIADTLLLPPGKLSFISTKMMSDLSEMTILEWLVKHNTVSARSGGASKLDIREVRGLETAGAGGITRMVAYRKSPQVLKLHIPMPHRFLPAWQAGPLRVEVPGVFRMGGLDLRRPDEVRYADGI